MAGEALWLDAQVRQYVDVEHPIYVDYATFLTNQLQRICRDVAPKAIVEARAKSPASFAAKALRKRHQYDDPVHQLTDLCGARVIAATQDEVNRVCGLVRARFTVDEERSGNKLELMGASQFGYSSVHFVVQPARQALGADDRPELLTRKAEIQVRTILQHAWANLAHDRLYKSPFTVPVALEREMNRAAALLEEVDRDFALILDSLSRYTGQAMVLEAERLQEEMHTLRLLIDVTTGDRDEQRELALQVAALARAQSDWPAVVTTLDPYAADGHAAVLREIGVALCRLDAPDVNGPRFRDGVQRLEAAVARNPDDADAHASLAWSLERIDAPRARTHYARAFELQPHSPYHLAACFEFGAADQARRADFTLLEPALRTAIDTCRRHRAAGVEVPRASFTEAKLQLLLDEPLAALAACARGIATVLAPRSTVAADVLHTELAAVRRLASANTITDRHRWMEALLSIAGVARRDGEAPSEPVIFVAGGSELQPEARRREQYLHVALDGFRGSIVRDDAPDGPDALDDTLQRWTDVLAAGTRPRDVRVLGIGGGTLAALRYQIALALGAEVGVVDGSGGAALDLTRSEFWQSMSNLRVIPDDRMSVKAFVSAGEKSNAPWLDAAAKVVHDTFLADNRHTRVDPAMLPWEQLSEDLKSSNRAQVSYATEILRAAGFGVRPVASPPGDAIAFDDPAIEYMAEMEHGRWNMERLRAGWVRGARDPGAKRSPYLVPWTELPEPVREWDRKAVRAFPEVLRLAGLEAYRL